MFVCYINYITKYDSHKVMPPIVHFTQFTRHIY